jgi:hypothetical protein
MMKMLLLGLVILLIVTPRLADDRWQRIFSRVQSCPSSPSGEFDAKMIAVGELFLLITLAVKPIMVDFPETKESFSESSPTS